jgi:chitin disaccharide deacetylase
MASDKQLIVNADDFGQSPGTNRGIIEAHEHGIVTSASLLVRWPAAAQAATYSQAHPQLNVGLHLDLGEWAYRHGEWVRLYQLIDENDAGAVAREVSAQIATFRSLMGRDPTHLDSHQHWHRQEPVRSIVLAMARELALPVRGFSEGIRYCGDFYGQTDEGLPYPEGISVQNLLRILNNLSRGCTELGCHPGYGRDLDTMYQAEREQEIKTLCDPRVLKAVSDMDIELAGFGQEQVKSHGRAVSLAVPLSDNRFRP